MNSLMFAIQDISSDAERMLQEINATPGEFGGDIVLPSTIFGIFLGAICFVLAFSFVVSAITTYFIYKPYSQLPEQFHTLSPALIWLLLVPIVNLVMIFFVALQVPDAFKRYFDTVGNHTVGDCGKTVGLIWGVSVLCGFIPVLNYIAWVPALVCMIMFIVKLWNMVAQLDAKVPLQKSVV